jgi:hypothetical protein
MRIQKARVADLVTRAFLIYTRPRYARLRRFVALGSFALIALTMFGRTSTPVSFKAATTSAGLASGNFARNAQRQRDYRCLACAFARRDGD